MPVLAQNLMMISKRFVVAAVIATVGGLAWIGLAGGPFGQRFGAILILVGFVMMMAPGSAFTRISMADAYAWLGKGPEAPETEPDSDRPRLTTLGVFLFVSLPLIGVGALLV